MKDEDIDEIPKGKAPEIVPEKLTAPINYKIIAGIIIGIFAIQAIITYSEEEPTALIYILSMGVPLIVGILSLVTGKRYKGMLVYGRAYTALGIAFLGLFGGELTYLIYEEYLELDPYPSIGDLFFFLLYVFTIMYLVIHIRFFSTKIANIDKLWMIAIPIGITAIYWMISFPILEGFNFDFYYGIVFVAAISSTLSLAVYGIRIFQASLTGIPWIILSIGILLFTLGDTWYYTLELYEGYELVHPVNLLWYAGYFIMIYALTLRRKVL